MTATGDPWREVSAARLPWPALAALARVCDRTNVRVHRAGDAAWVCWPAGSADVVRCLLPAEGVEFYVRRGERWFRFGRRTPTSDVPPDDEGRPVSAVLLPARFDVLASSPPAASRVALRIAHGGPPQPVAALACPLAELRQWADTATTLELAAVRAALAGDRAVLLGSKLPAVASATRFWGRDVFVPAGFRPDPDLPPAVLRAAVGAAADDLVFLDADGADLIPKSAFAPLTRAGLRLALREGGVRP
jgi:hypothetical protein